MVGTLRFLSLFHVATTGNYDSFHGQAKVSKTMLGSHLDTHRLLSVNFIITPPCLVIKWALYLGGELLVPLLFSPFQGLYNSNHNLLDSLVSIISPNKCFSHTRCILPTSRRAGTRTHLSSMSEYGSHLSLHIMFLS